jgi:outer membrane protein
MPDASHLNQPMLLLRAGALAGLLTLAPATPAETLQDAWTAALESHRQIAAAESRRDAASSDLERAQSERLPQLGVVSDFTQLDEAPRFDFGGGQTSQQLFANDNFVTAGVQLSLPLYAGGGINAGIDAADYAATASDGRLAAVIKDIKLGAGERFIMVLRAESALAVAESNVATLEALTADAKNRFDVGDVPRNDYLATSVSLANAEQRRLQAENALDYARAAYNRFLNRALDQPVSLDPALGIDDLLPAGSDLDALIRTAVEQRDELDALSSQAAALREQSTAARSRSRPQFALTGGYMYLENQFLTAEDFWMAGVSFQWSPFDGGRSRHEANALEYRAKAVNHTRDDLATEIELQVRQAWNDREEALNRTRVTETAVEQAIENLRVVRDRYAAGASANVEVLDAEALRQQALSNRDDARYGLALARLRLARAAGLL